MNNELRFNGETHPLSNFYPAKINVDGKIYKTAEHYYQSEKATNTMDKSRVMQAESPSNARRIGKQIKKRADFDEIKDIIMYKGVKAKFTQNVEVKAYLLATGDRYLIEDASFSPYWGTGYNDMGENKMGKMLMQIRDELKQEMIS